MHEYYEQMNIARSIHLTDPSLTVICCRDNFRYRNEMTMWHPIILTEILIHPFMILFFLRFCYIFLLQMFCYGWWPCIYSADYIPTFLELQMRSIFKECETMWTVCVKKVWIKCLNLTLEGAFKAMFIEANKLQPLLCVALLWRRDF